VASYFTRALEGGLLRERREGAPFEIFDVDMNQWHPVSLTREVRLHLRPVGEFKVSVIEAEAQGRLNEFIEEMTGGGPLLCGTPILDALALVGRLSGGGTPRGVGGNG
jgi:hypothetical protein